MSTVMQINPFEFFVDGEGTALDDGYVWIGQPNKHSPSFPVAIFYDEALAIPAAQPLRTSGGYVVRNGSPTFLYINGNYSILVQDKNQRTVFYVPDFLMIGTSSAISASELYANVNVTVSTIADLKALDWTLYRFASLIGFNARGDGVTAMYWADYSDTTSVGNDGMVVVANDGTRVKRLGNGRNTNKLYTEEGAIVERFGDRLFVGGATLNTGTEVVAQPDWLTTYQLARGRLFGTLQSSQSAILTTESLDSGVALAVASKTGSQHTNNNAVSLTSITVNNATTGTGLAYGVYVEAFRDIGAPGGAYAIEVDNVNLVGVVSIDPYFQLLAQTIGLQIAAGAELSPAGQFANTAAINIRNNGSTYQTGIVFGSTSISGTDGVNGTGIAISMGKGHTVQWYGAQAAPSSSIQCVGTTTSGGTLLRFGNGFVNWLNAQTNTPVLQFTSDMSHVNYLTITSSAPGNPVQLSASGTDPNRDIQMNCTDVWLGTYTAGAPAATGSIRVKDAAGNVTRLLAAQP